jgi:septal ring factor EnvC (AmiA/AmiB activator)
MMRQRGFQAYFIAAVAVGVIIVLAGAYALGRSAGVDAQKTVCQEQIAEVRRELKAQADAAEVNRRTLQDYANWLGKKYADELTKRRASETKLEEEIRKYETEHADRARGECFNADELRLVNRIIRGETEGGRGAPEPKRDAPVP